MITFNSKKKQFELVYIIKDSQGEPTNVKRSIETNSSAKLAYAWFSSNPPRKRKQKPNDRSKSAAKKTKALPGAKEADTILKYMYKNKDTETSEKED